jgi:hypothetical protein
VSDNSVAVGTYPLKMESHAVAYPGIIFAGGSTNSLEDKEEREW